MSNMRTTTCRTGFRPSTSIPRFGLDYFQDTVHTHDLGNMSRVVMVRKTDQRTFASAKNGEEPKYETVTKETYETFRGNRTERKMSIEKRGVFDRFPVEFRESITPLSKPTISGESTVKSGSPTGKMSASLSTSRHDLKKLMDPVTFANDCLAAHNEYRQKHNVPPLKLNRQMCKMSQQWADTLAIRGKLTHSENKEFGENIFSFWSNDLNYVLSGKEPADSWYNEIKCHIFGEEPTSLQSGHFTQVIWKESKELGVAFSKKDGKFIVVANYSPPGNCLGNFTENVPPVGGFPTVNVTAINGVSQKLMSGFSKLYYNEVDLKFEEDCLSKHNEYRAKHGVEPLKLNRKMCKESKEWAKHLAAKGKIEHRKYVSFGENIYCCWSSNPSNSITGKEPVESWYSEINFHDFTREPTDLRSGHFTQVVWKTSRELGVGIEKNRSGQIFVVASYSPAGNYVGSFRDNVLPSLSSSPVLNGCEVTEDFAAKALKTHNEYRRKHGVKDLKLNQMICNYAQKWADHLALEGKLAHRPDSKYGENIFYMWSSDPSATPTAREVCDKWYAEIKDFTFGIESRTPKAGHFTQMIWKESTELGIAIAKGKKNGKTFVVANYSPKGNYIGKYCNNVPKPLLK